MHIYIISLIFIAIISVCKKDTITKGSKVLASDRHRHKPGSSNYFLVQSQHSLEDVCLF